MRYRPDGEEVLRGLRFRVGPGEKIGVVGRTGAGKSSLAMAISRIVEVEGSEIKEGKEAWRRLAREMNARGWEVQMEKVAEGAVEYGGEVVPSKYMM